MATVVWVRRSLGVGERGGLRERGGASAVRVLLFTLCRRISMSLLDVMA